MAPDTGPRRIVWTALIAMAVFLGPAGGCGKPGAKLDSDAVRATSSRGRSALIALKFPDEQFITAWGYSKNSLHEAELDAKARISEQIASSITAETRSTATAWMKNGEISDQQFLESTVTSQSSFERAELIRFARESSSSGKGNDFRAFGYLDRAELGKDLEGRYQDQAAMFREASARALAAGPNPIAFTQSWHAARTAFQELFKVACQFSAVTRRQPVDLDRDRKLSQDLELARSRLLGSAQLTLHIAPSDEIDIPTMAAAVRGALVSLGVTVSGQECGPEAVLHLDLQPEVTWQQMMGVKFCKVRLLGTASECQKDASEIPIVVSGSAMEGRGSDPAASFARRVTPEALAPLLRESLGAVMPLGNR